MGARVRARASVIPWCTGTKEELGRGSTHVAHEGSPSKNGNTQLHEKGSTPRSVLSFHPCGKVAGGLLFLESGIEGLCSRRFITSSTS